MKNLKNLLVFASVLLVSAVIVVSCSKDEQKITDSYDYGIASAKEFKGKSVGEIHNIVLEEMLNEAKVSSQNTEDEVFSAFQDYFMKHFQTDISILEISKFYKDYGDPIKLSKALSKIDSRKSNDLSFALEVYQDLEKYRTNSRDIGGLHNIIDNYTSKVENGIIKVDDKVAVLHSLDVFKYSTTFWLSETNDKAASCTLKVVACDLLGSFLGPNVGILASGYSYINTCN